MERDGRSRACPEIIPAGISYCRVHYGQKRAKYGADHRRRRRDYQGRINHAPIKCASCPTMLTGTDWDLGHDDDGQNYVGPQCRPCNRRDGANKLNQR
ncbi:MAG: hypothetical protein FWG25_10450 [Promicromonosporaceae bacterium]|nr:hypothetical protein [Promicromonosporaceae bacterium]